ncbi:hypothetical protein OF83DRAFT_1087708 [Amylostereum chailletii]|nr:hypothetical protein OF83DRAFT_1087708 [Amylostereum chailletii]
MSIAVHSMQPAPFQAAPSHQAPGKAMEIFTDMSSDDAERAELLQVLIDVFDWRICCAAAHLTRPEAFMDNAGHIVSSWEWDSLRGIKTSVQYEMAAPSHQAPGKAMEIFTDMSSVLIDVFDWRICCAAAHLTRPEAFMDNAGHIVSSWEWDSLRGVKTSVQYKMGYPCTVPDTLHGVYLYFYEAEGAWADIPATAARQGSTDSTTPALHLPIWWTWIDEGEYDVREGFTQVINMALGEEIGDAKGMAWKAWIKEQAERLASVGTHGGGLHQNMVHERMRIVDGLARLAQRWNDLLQGREGEFGEMGRQGGTCRKNTPGNTPGPHTGATHQGYTPGPHAGATHQGHTPGPHAGATRRVHMPGPHTGATRWGHTLGEHAREHARG